MTPLNFQKLNHANDLMNQSRALKDELIAQFEEIIDAYGSGEVSGFSRDQIQYGIPFRLSIGWVGTLVTENLHRDGYDIIKKEGKAGYTLPIHYHNVNEKTIVVLSGSVKIETENVVTILEPMQSFHIKNNIPHTVVAITDCMILSIFKPPIVN